MKRILYSLIVLASVATTGCKKDNASSDVVTLTDFEITETLEGRPVELDTVLGLPGGIKIYDDDYILYLYDSDYLFAVTDADFKIKSMLAKKGMGPNETTGLWAYGQKSPDGGFYAFEPSTSRLKRINPATPELLETVADFKSLPDSIRPVSAVRLSDGNYVFVRENMVPGLIYYDPATGNSRLLDDGLDIKDLKNPNPFIASRHVINYNEKNNVIGEIYDAITTLILRDNEGRIIRKIQYGNPSTPSEVENTKMSGVLEMDSFKDFFFSDNHIYLVFKGASEDSPAHLIITDYDGNGIADLTMPYGTSFEIDTKNRRIIAVDPNNESNIIVYDLPDNVVNP